MLKYFLISTFLFTSVSFSQNVSGNVKDLLFNTPLEEVSITVKDNTTGWLVGTDSTDASGNYSIDYIIVGVNENNSIPTDYYLSNPYPQPFNPSTRLEFSTPKQDNFSVRIYNIIGQLVFDKAFTLDAGQHSFNVNNLGSAGIYLFNISSADYTSTQKLVLLDGGSGNVNVELVAAGNIRSNKSSITEFLIEFRKAGYIDKDTVVAWDMNLTVNIQLNQVAGTGTFQFAGHLTGLPTYTNGTNVNVVIKDFALNETLCSTVTDTNGNYNCNIDYAYYINPTNPSEIIYSPSLLKVYLSGQNYTAKDSNFVFNGSNLNWNTTIQQTTIAREAHIFGVVTDSITGLGVNNAFIQLYKVSDNSLITDTYTDNNGLYSRIFIFSGYEGDPLGVFNNIGDMKYVISKDGYFTKDSVKSFAVINDVDFKLTQIPPPVRNWVWHVQDPLDNPLDPTIYIRTNEGTVYTFPPRSDGIYNISIATFDTTIKVWWEHPDLQNIGYIMPPNKQGQDFNIAQNERVAPGSLDTLTVSNIDLLEQYQFTKLKMIHNFVDGRDMLSNEVKRIIVGRRGYNTTRFMAEPSLNLPQLDIVIKGWYYWNNQILTPGDSSRIMTITSNVAYLIKDLDYQIHYIYSENDPIWQEIVARGGDNVLEYQYRLGTPGNVILYTGASNGLIRNYYGRGQATQGNSDMTWAAEIMQPMFSLNDPNEVQDLGPWIYVNGVGPTQFARYIAAYISEADNQKYWYISGNKFEKELIEDPFTSTPTWGSEIIHNDD